jgi:hypothetical protein
VQTTATVSFVAGEKYTASLWAKNDGSFTGLPTVLLWNPVTPVTYCQDTLASGMTATWTLYTATCTPSTTGSSYLAATAQTAIGATGTFWLGGFSFNPQQPFTPGTLLQATGPYGIGPATNATGKIINGVSYCANYAGGDVSAKVNACIADAIGLTNGNTTGIADASALSGYNVTTSEIDVGNSSGAFVELLLPCTGYWSGSMTGGTAYTVKYYAGAEMKSNCPVSATAGQFNLGATNTSNLMAVFTAVTSSLNYLHLSGFQIQNFGTATASGYGAIFNGQFADGSSIDSVNVFDGEDTAGGALLLENVCCGFTWAHSAISGDDVTTPVVIKASDSPSTYVQDLIFSEGSIVQNAPGKPLIACTDTKSTHLTNITWSNEYFETATSTPSGALIIDTNCSKLAFDHIQTHSNSASNTQTFLSATANTAVSMNDMFFGPSLGTWTYPVDVLTQSGVTTQYTDTTGHYDHYATATSPAAFGPLTAASVAATGVVSTGANIGFTDNSTACTPTSGQACIRADSTTNTFRATINNVAEQTMWTGFATTGTITGTALSGTCDSGTVTVAGAVAGRPVTVSSTTGADLGAAFSLRASVTSANTVTVYICGTGTPASLAYNVTVH